MYNVHDELVARKKMEETGGNLGDVKFVRATWMSDGSHWPGTWLSDEPDHSRGDHAGIIQVRISYWFLLFYHVMWHYRDNIFVKFEFGNYMDLS